MGKRGPKARKFDLVSLSIRVTRPIKEALEAAAARHGTNLTNETERRLRRSLEGQEDDAWTGALFQLIRAALKEVERESGAKWHESAYAFAFARFKVLEALQLCSPSDPKIAVPDNHVALRVLREQGITNREIADSVKRQLLTDLASYLRGPGPDNVATRPPQTLQAAVLPRVLSAIEQEESASPESREVVVRLKGRLPEPSAEPARVWPPDEPTEDDFLWPVDREPPKEPKKKG